MARTLASKIGLYLGFIVLTISIPAAVFLATQPGTTIFQGQADLSKSSLMYLWPAKMDLTVCPAANLNTCTASKVSVILSTKTVVSGFKLAIKYDPAKIYLADDLIYPGLVDDQKNTLLLPFDYYTNRYVNNQEGIMKLEANGQVKNEKATIATFWIVPKSTGDTKIEIVNSSNLLDSTKVFDESGKNNVLGSVQPLEITIK